ncbi:MAG: folate-binding protein YgfZ [Gemmatimonadetes bacterium]|nr:folate-binding protein YgfZ [Gemmatimonadota bacterium]
MTMALVPRGAQTTAVAGHDVVLHYGDAGLEYHALRHGALLLDRSERGRGMAEGAKARETLTGLVTNDVLGLNPGDGQHAVALTAKGKVIADVRLFSLAPDRIWIDIAPRCAQAWWDMIRKYVNPRLAKVRSEAEAWRHLTIAGPESRAVVAKVTGLALEVLEAVPAEGIREVAVPRALRVARSSEIGVEAWDLWVPAADAADLRTRAIAAGAQGGGLVAWEIARVEHGRPEFGLDMDDTTIPQEANLDEWHAISYTKGCYTGQETVARVHFRGHVNRHVRGLRFDAASPMPPGTVLRDAEGNDVGDVRSSVLSPRLGPIAPGMVRREVAVGAVLVAHAADGAQCPVLVHALPFGAH